MTANSVKISIDKGLLEDYTKKYPELKGLTFTGIADIMLRKALEAKQ